MDIKLVQKLIKALEYEEATYGRLLSLSEKKTEYLVKSDTAALSQLTEEENQLIDQTRQLSKVREQLIAMLYEGNADMKDATLENIKNSLPQDQAAAMGRIQRKLKETVLRLASRNSINQRLIEKAIQYIDFNLELITAPRATTPIYGKSGEEISGGHKRSMLDIKY